MLPPIVEFNEYESCSTAEQIMENCRLGKLNFDCLEKIFEHLGTGELIELCKIDQFVCNAVKERAIAERMINFSEWKQIWGTEMIFKEIGQRIKHMSIAEADMCQQMCQHLSPFDQFLRFLSKYCSKNRLKSLSLNFDVSAMDANLLESARPFLTNIQQILFTSMSHMPNIGQDQFFITLIECAKQLSTIQLVNTTIDGKWLRLENMKNVENVALIDSIIFDSTNWQSYFERQPTLKFFAWINCRFPNYTLCENIARNCTQLERFVDYQHLVHDKYLQRDFVMNRYNYFGLFENLKCARITAYTSSGRDLTGVFMALSQKNTLETLGINFIMNTISQYNAADRLGSSLHYTQFTSLKSLHIQNHSPCFFWHGNLINFMSCMVNLREVSISGPSQINSVQITCIALKAPKLITLKLNGAMTGSDDLCMALQTIAKVKEINPNSKDGIFTVVLNTDQMRQLEGQNFGDNIRIVNANRL